MAFDYSKICSEISTLQKNKEEKKLNVDNAILFADFFDALNTCLRSGVLRFRTAEVFHKDIFQVLDIGIYRITRGVPDAVKKDIDNISEYRNYTISVPSLTDYKDTARREYLEPAPVGRFIDVERKYYDGRLNTYLFRKSQEYKQLSKGVPKFLIGKQFAIGTRHKSLSEMDGSEKVITPAYVYDFGNNFTPSQYTLIVMSMEQALQNHLLSLKNELSDIPKNPQKPPVQKEESPKENHYDTLGPLSYEDLM